MEGFFGGTWDWLRDHFESWSLLKVYIGCAIAGGTVLVSQAGLNLFGLGDASDVDADVGVDDIDSDDMSSSFLSVRALASFITLFGLVGWLGTAAEWGSTTTVFAAFASGMSVMVIVAYLMRAFQRIQSKGNLDPRDAVGKTARVYLRVPGKLAGKGKITVVLQGRSNEFDAVTAGETLPSGSDCRVVEMKTEDTFLIEPLT